MPHSPYTGEQRRRRPLPRGQTHEQQSRTESSRPNQHGPAGGPATRGCIDRRKERAYPESGGEPTQPLRPGAVRVAGQQRQHDREVVAEGADDGH